MASRYKINDGIIRELELALEAARSLETVALSNSCHTAVQPYIDKWVADRIDRALAMIDERRGTKS